MGVIDNLKSLITAANQTTGKADADMTAATKSLIAGYGGKGPSYSWLKTASLSPDATKGITEDAVFDLSAAGNLSDFGRFCNFGCNKITLKVSDALNLCNNLLQTTSANESNLRQVEFVGGSKNLKALFRAFLGQRNIERIKGINFPSATYTHTFEQCNSLKEVRFASLSVMHDLSLADSPLLSAASVINLIDALADLSSQSPQTLTLHPDVKAKLTPEQISTITSKNWTLA